MERDRVGQSAGLHALRAVAAGLAGDVLARAERITWRVEDIIGNGKTLDFARPFMPEALARTEGMAYLSAAEKRTLNQIRGHAYLALFGLVEEFILPFVLDHARPYINGEDYRARAFLEFASEEAKHIHLFRRFREEFTAGFGAPCEVIGPPAAIRKHVLSHAPRVQIDLDAIAGVEAQRAVALDLPVAANFSPFAEFSRVAPRAAGRQRRDSWSGK